MRRAVCLLALVVGALPTTAAAEDDDPPGLDYLVSDGALPFLYGSTAVTLGLHFFAEPPEEPLLFLPTEGGEARRDDTIPEIAVAGYAAAGGAVVALIPGPARWQHLKGYAEAVATTLALTEISKNVFGRRRPHFDGRSSDSIDDRRSFFSGHASVTAVSTLYLGYYLREHGFARARGDAYLPLWEVGAYVGLAAIFLGVPATRLADNRHHTSDVVVGAAVGSVTAAVFYAYHARLLEDRKRRVESPMTRPLLLPDVENRGLMLVGFF